MECLFYCIKLKKTAIKWLKEQKIKKNKILIIGKTIWGVYRSFCAVFVNSCNPKVIPNKKFIKRNTVQLKERYSLYFYIVMSQTYYFFE